MPILLFKAHPAVQGATSAPARDINARLQRLAERRGDPTVLLLPSPGEPTVEQARSGEYKKLRDSWRGQPVKIESPAGSVRRGTNRDNVTWEQRILFDYGEFLGTKGVDGDPVDVFFGPDPDATMVYVVHQRKVNRWTEFDEDKCMVDFPDQEAATAAFLACYNDPRFLGPITAMPVEDFIVKLRATREAPAMIKGQDFGTLVLFTKAHIDGYTKKDGTYVKPHEDKRPAAKQQQGALELRDSTGGDQVIVFPYASGMSRKRDMSVAIDSSAGLGVEVGELSDAGMTRIADAVAADKPVFVDSGAFNAFKQALRKGDMSLARVDFDRIFEKYNELSRRVVEKTHGDPGSRGLLMLVAPDVIGDQEATLKLIEEHREQIMQWIEVGHEVIVPFQRGPVDQFDAFMRVQEALEHLPFVVGIPSAAAALGNEDLAKFLSHPYKPHRIHILGAVSSRRMDERMAVIREAYVDDVPGVTADANVMRSKLHELGGLAGDEKAEKIKDILDRVVPTLYGGKKPMAKALVDDWSELDEPPSVVLLTTKAHVGAYLRGGKLVNLAGYQGRDASAKPAPGQLALFPAAPPQPKPVAPPPAPAAPPAKQHPLAASAERIAKLEESRDAARARNDDRMAAFYDGPVLTSHRAVHAKLQSAFDAYNKNGDGTELSDDEGKRHAILLPDASSPGKYRYQMFDEHGFSAHSTHDSPEEAVADAARSGFHVPNPGILDKLAGTDEWAHGMAINAIVQAINGGQMSHKEGMEKIHQLNQERAAAMTPAKPVDPEPDHPAPVPRMQLKQVPEDKRDEWLRLHRQQHELHHYEMGQAKERRERARSKMYAAQTKMREAENGAASFRKDGLPGAEDRAREFDAAANRHRADFERHRADVDRESDFHQTMYEKVAKLGREKDKILPLSGEMDIDWLAQRKRTAEEQAKHEKEQLAMYRAHYKEMGKKKPMAKAWGWMDTQPIGRPPPAFVLLA